jgi:hypothetical protein
MCGSVLGQIRTGGLNAAQTGAGGGVSSVQLQNEIVFVKGQAIVTARGNSGTSRRLKPSTLEADPSLAGFLGSAACSGWVF